MDALSADLMVVNLVDLTVAYLALMTVSLTDETRAATKGVKLAA